MPLGCSPDGKADMLVIWVRVRPETSPHPGETEFFIKVADWQDEYLVGTEMTESLKVRDRNLYDAALGHYVLGKSVIFVERTAIAEPAEDIRIVDAELGYDPKHPQCYGFRLRRVPIPWEDEGKKKHVASWLN